MPAIETLVADINNGAIQAVGIEPQGGGRNGSSTISATCLVEHNFMHTRISLGAAPQHRMMMANALDSLSFNASYLFFEDSRATVATMDVNRRIVISGGYGGCLYQVYNLGNGVFKCCHIARPAGVGAEANVNLMNNYARQAGWTLLQTVPTVGLIGNNNCQQVMTVSQITPNRRIETVRIQVGVMGVIVGTTAYSDAI